MQVRRLIYLCSALLGIAQAQPLCPEATTKLKTLVTDGAGRLFTVSTLQDDFDARAFKTDLQDMGSRLRRLGSSVVAVPVPWKAMSVVPLGQNGSPQLLGFEPLKARRGYWNVMNTFRGAGIKTVDVLSLFLNSKETLYFNTDHHWTPQGAQLAATGIRPLIPTLTMRNLGNPSPLPAPQFKGTFEFTGSHAELANTVCPPTWPLEHTFESVSVNLPEQGLLDDQKVPVLLFGSSFSRSNSENKEDALPGYGFEQWVTANLGTPVQNEAFSSGSQGGWLEYLASHVGNPLPPLIIWELPIADFALEQQATTALFFDQLIPLLSLTEFPAAASFQVLQASPVKLVKLTYDLGSLPAHAFMQIQLAKATALTPTVTIEGAQGKRTAVLKRGGNKMVSMPRYALRLPTNLGPLKRLVIEWPVASSDLAPPVQAVTIHTLK